MRPIEPYLGRFLNTVSIIVNKIIPIKEPRAKPKEKKSKTRYTISIHKRYPAKKAGKKLFRFIINPPII